jgi:hypothetical protein
MAVDVTSDAESFDEETNASPPIETWLPNQGRWSGGGCCGLVTLPSFG